ncbi:DUF2190 family protein [Sinirhodobacter populi]|uniref:DUF2190 family protein n=1 Tax=Paenirhodobacter populi TaxID=2306993 RepID=A0A443KET0_9RHOB|nr:DUF2190 family protein [Sinirhodobacter populi]RWR31351.1 DUF2190 family protein [Sinirhodobacter populi]
MKNWKYPGENLTVPAPAAVASGDFVTVGAITGVAQGDAAAGEGIVIVRRGVFELPKIAAQAWTLGVKLYWDADNSVVTSTADSNLLIGAAAAVAADPSQTGLVLLDGVIR